MNIKGWLAGAWSAVRKIQVGRLLKPLWKRGAKAVLWTGGDELQRRVRQNVDDDADASIRRVNKLFDGWQDRVIEELHELPLLPKAWAATLAEKVKVEGDQVQAALVASIKTHGPAAVDLAFDGLQDRLARLIDEA